MSEKMNDPLEFIEFEDFKYLKKGDIEEIIAKSNDKAMSNLNYEREDLDFYPLDFYYDKYSL